MAKPDIEQQDEEDEAELFGMKVGFRIEEDGPPRTRAEVMRRAASDAWASYHLDRALRRT